MVANFLDIGRSGEAYFSPSAKMSEGGQQSHFKNIVTDKRTVYADFLPCTFLKGDVKHNKRYMYDVNIKIYIQYV